MESNGGVSRSNPLKTRPLGIIGSPRVSNQRFINSTIPELNCPRNLSSTVARLRTGHFKGLKISPDNSRSETICRNWSKSQLTPDYIFDCKALFASLSKLDASPRRIFLQSSSSRPGLACYRGF
ncbi:hypothetical protein TNCV_1436771 [Trichonephila clavipes]|nr:hypothetical protein TNCV_1436771 [Trichonephila clavipes]